MLQPGTFTFSRWPSSAGESAADFENAFPLTFHRRSRMKTNAKCENGDSSCWLWRRKMTMVSRLKICYGVAGNFDRSNRRKLKNFERFVPKEKLKNENEDRRTMVRICKVDWRIRKFLKRKYRGFFRLKNYLCRTGDSFTLPKIYVSCDFHDTFSIDNEVLISLLSVNLLNIEFMWFRITLYVTSSLL